MNTNQIKSDLLHKFSGFFPFKPSTELPTSTDLVVKAFQFSDGIHVFLTAAMPTLIHGSSVYWPAAILPNYFQTQITFESNQGVNMVRYSKSIGYGTLELLKDDLFKSLSGKAVFLLVDETTTTQNSNTLSTIGISALDVKKEVIRRNPDYKVIDTKSSLAELFRLEKGVVADSKINALLSVTLS